MEKDYKDIKELYIKQNNFLMEGVFYVENSNIKFDCFIIRDGSLVFEKKNEAEELLYDPFNNEVALFASDNKKHYVFEDHNTKTFRANVSGVIYPNEFKKHLVEISKTLPNNNLNLNSSDKAFVEYMDYCYEVALEQQNHPSSKKNKI